MSKQKAVTGHNALIVYFNSRMRMVEDCFMLSMHQPICICFETQLESKYLFSKLEMVGMATRASQIL